MNYEKKYKECVEKARKIKEENPELWNSPQCILRDFFTELAESEDEKIREELIEYFTWNAQQILDNFDNKDVIAWLEKQGKNDMGISEATKQKLEDSLNKALEKETPESWNKILDEQKPADGVEPKFKVGDWVVNKQNEIARINQIFEDTHGTQRYHIGFTDGTKTYPRPCDADDDYRLWTIQDAKDGDVLAAKIDKEPNDFIYIFKGHDQNGFSSYCYLDAYINKFHEGMYHNTHNVGVPATKEQRDLLFQKMKEAGYEWDAEKNVLEKIEQTPAAYFYCKHVGTTPKCGDCVRNHLNSKYKTEEIKTWMTPASRGTKQCSDYIPKDSVKWSVEDEVGLGDALWAIEQARTVAKDENDMGNLWYAERWLRALKESLHTQPKQELSEDASTSEYIDLGLPSGTLWKLFNEEGYYTYDEAVEKFMCNLPTEEQWEELKNECEWEWKGNGYDVTGPNGNIIFLPAVGFRFGTGVYDLGTDGNYWLGTCNCEGSAYSMCFRDGNIGMYYHYRGSGLSVRIVK